MLTSLLPGDHAWMFPEPVKEHQLLDKNRKFCERGFIPPTDGDSHMALTKHDIVEQVYNDLGFSKNQSVETVEALLELIKASLASGEDILVSGFGKFCVKNKNERKGRNPATGEDAILPARRVVTFKCSGKLRKTVNGN
jgi:integration host factor subunit alpha